MAKLSALSKQYPIWLSDVWGVVHDGIKPITSAVKALQNHRAQGGKVILITNAPRPSPTIIKHLDHMGVAKSAYDGMVSSGDVTRNLMLDHGKNGIYHFGPEVDDALFQGLELPKTALEKSAAVVCTGFPDRNLETPKDYLPILKQMRALNLKMICANPDKVVRIGDILEPCAGALAEGYEILGGEVLMAGKPFAPIYDAALALAGNPGKSKVLAIGDGPETDIKGAMQNHLPCVFVTGGINTSATIISDVKKRYPTARILSTMKELDWA